ncbi:MAG TPA: TonB family protein, partial [Kofleriaceae bacterium]
MTRILVLIALLLPATAWAQDAGVDDAPPADAGPPADAAPPPTQGFEPPKAMSSTEIPEPPGAPAHTDVIVVTVKISVDTDGHVAKVDLLTDPQPPFDDAVIEGAKKFTFEPGRFNGAAVPVEITFTQKFQPPPPPATPTTPTDTGPAKTSVLHGKLIELGTRQVVASATVTVQIAGRTYTAEGDQKGHFELPIPPGKVRITVTAGGHNTFVQEETVAAKQDLGVTYLLERDRYDPYEIVVTGEQRREEVSRITLKGPEIKQVPGTFGDPFRVVQALPGVASAISLLPFPIIRGASPSSTGFLLDGTRVPLLY